MLVVKSGIFIGKLAAHSEVHSEEKISDHLLNRPYVNGVSLGNQNLYLNATSHLSREYVSNNF